MSENRKEKDLQESFSFLLLYKSAVSEDYWAFIEEFLKGVNE